MADMKHTSSGFERSSRDRRSADKSQDARHGDSKPDREAETRDR